MHTLNTKECAQESERKTSNLLHNFQQDQNGEVPQKPSFYKYSITWQSKLTELQPDDASSTSSPFYLTSSYIPLYQQNIQNLSLYEQKVHTHSANHSLMMFILYKRLTLKVLVTTLDAQWEGMGDVGSARYELALRPPCLTIRVLSYSN